MVRLYYEEIKKGGRREEKKRKRSQFFLKNKKKQSILKRELTEIAIARCTLRRISDIFLGVLLTKNIIEHGTCS